MSNLNNVQNVNQNITANSSLTSSPVTPGGVTGHGGHGGGIGHRESSKSINDRLKAFFKGLAKTPSSGSGISGSGTGYLSAKTSEASTSCILLTEDLVADLAHTQPLQTRVKALKMLTDSCRSGKIEPHSMETLWIQTSDMFQSSDTYTRHICFQAFTTMFRAQTEKPGFLRAKLFSLLKAPNKPEDIYYRFQLLKVLSENGKNLTYFEERVGPLLYGWMVTGEIFGTGSSSNSSEFIVSVEDFMGLLTNVVKFNCSFLDDDVLGGLIQCICVTALTCSSTADALSCVNLLGNIIMYSMIPPNTVQVVAATLCRTVNLEALCVTSWKVMRNLLGTHLGYSGLFTLIQFMNSDCSIGNPSSNGSEPQRAHNPDALGINGEKTNEGVVSQTEMNSLIRGAVFYTGVVLWGGGNRVVRNLTTGGTAGGNGGGIFGVVLGAYKKALERSSPLVTYEVLLRVQDLIRNNADSLRVVGWDLILEIMLKIVDFSKQQDYHATLFNPAGIHPSDERAKGHQQLLRNNQQLLSQIHDTLDLIENVLPTKTFCSDSHKYWEQIVEPVCHSRPISSVENLLKHKHFGLLNSSQTSFFPKLVQFAHLHFQKETRVPLRLQALISIKKICLLNQDTMEESLLDNVILPNLKNVEHESNITIREHCIQFIVEFLMESRSKKGHDLLHYVEKVVNRPFELEKNEQFTQPLPFTESDVHDVLVGISGIIRIFRRKIYSLPSSIAVTAFKILVRHLEKHYKAKHNCLENCSQIRYMIFECFFKIRANALYHLGFPNDDGTIEAYSNYLAVDHRDPRESGSGDRDQQLIDNLYGGGSHLPSASGVSPPIVSLAVVQGQPQDKQGVPMVSYISLTAACKQVICCLKKERDWKILELVLLQLPNVMENKALILSKHGNDVDILASHLCTMVKEAPSFDISSSTSYSTSSASVRNTPQRFSRSDYQSFVYPALTSLVSYHSSLDTKLQQQIVKCLEHGLVSKSSRICISALTTCTLEMKEVMHKLIPEILLSLSKISPKPNIAIPVLEFLSTLIHLPRVFASFVQEQYMAIFAICLPYTNPFKFNPYVVSLAHHVIALWFLKCRLSFRKGFVSYIIKSLESNVWTPIMEVTEKTQLVNEDSSNRKRSSSLTDQSNRRRERIVSGQNGGQGLSRQTSQPMDTGLMQFHHELTETCVDLMARYAFADCSPLPSRFESAGFLTQHGGNTQSWMIDNRIITISTSGCSQRELREGLCDRCWVQCKQHNQQQQGRSLRKQVLVGQHSYDEEDAKDSNSLGTGVGEKVGSGAGVKRSNTISGSGSYSGGSAAARRRHRSAMVQQQQQEEHHQKQQHHDDLHLEHKLSADVGRGLVDGIRLKKEGTVTAQVCMCWCQGWAEVLIRRPTGNTSWMMRVQNQIGGGGKGWAQGFGGAGDMLVSNLWAMYLNDIVDGARNELEDEHGHKQGHSNQVEDGGSGDGNSQLQTKLEEITAAASLETATTSENGKDNQATATTSKTVDDCSDQQGKGDNTPSKDVQRSSSVEEECKKTPVKRSNSSPEMAKSLSVGGIGEVDEGSVIEVGGTEKQKQNNISTTYITSCDPIPEETSKRSESESEMPSVNITVKSVSASSSPPLTPHAHQQLDNPLMHIKRDRTSTVAVMSPAWQSATSRSWRNNSQPTVRRMMSVGSADMARAGVGSGGLLGGSDPGIRSGISPSFIFLQLCGQGIFGSHPTSKPLPLPANDATSNSLKVLDYIPPYETHKIGVLYVGAGQAKNESEIFQNSHGSLRYQDFLQGLGTLIKLSEVDPQKTFLGGLDGKGLDDGQFACIWQDDVMQVIFHAATLMPTKDTDPNCNGKKRHIGNDFVAIIYNNSDEEFDISTIKCQFLYACVIIQPLDHRTNRVYVKAKPALMEHIGHNDVKIVSDQNLPIMARQLALHSNLASVIFRKLSQNSEPYASNWLERLRAIKRLRAKNFPDSLTGGGKGSSGGLSSSAQELSESMASGGAGVANNTGGVPKRNSFGVDDFTEYV